MDQQGLEVRCPVWSNEPLDGTDTWSRPKYIGTAPVENDLALLLDTEFSVLPPLPEIPVFSSFYGSKWFK